MTKVEKNARGFAYIEFKDTYGQECSLQKSSQAFVDRIWLGCDKDLEHKKSSRMLLSRGQVKMLLPLLQRFARTGELEPGSRPKPMEDTDK